MELRGNVDTRLRRLREPRGSERQLDGVVLAFAGLARLWQDESVGAAALLRELLAGLPRMVLPLTLCPAAPAQGALAIECRSDDARTRALLAASMIRRRARRVAAERALLAERGGGCHQRFGATQVQVAGLGALLYLREADDSGAGAAAAALAAAARRRPRRVRAWDGSAQRAPDVEPLCRTRPRNAPQRAGRAPGAAFIAHRRALPGALDAARSIAAAHMWVPGTETWFALAARGVWVEGCAESLGFEALRATLAAPLLRLPPLREWLVLTHAEARGVAGARCRCWRPTVIAPAPSGARGRGSPAMPSHV